MSCLLAAGCAAPVASVTAEPVAKAPPRAKAPQQTEWIGKPAPAFTLPSLDGTSVSLSDFKGKYVVVHFGTGW